MSVLSCKLRIQVIYIVTIDIELEDVDLNLLRVDGEIAAESRGGESAGK